MHIIVLALTRSSWRQVGATSYAVAGVWREESRDRSLRRYWREQSQTEDGVYAGAVAQVGWAQSLAISRAGSQETRSCN